MSKLIQFNWRRHWRRKVEPHLNKDMVQRCLDFGMRLLDPTWKRGNAPYLLGGIGFRRIIKGKLSWYQPLGRCHWISFFSMAIGAINYPDLRWKMMSGDLHTVPVGYDKSDDARVVMDILLFDSMTAEQSIAYAQKVLGEERATGWDACFQGMEEEIVPLILATCA